MPSEVLKSLLECGVHFGHQTRRWNPKMKKFIFGERSGIYIIDLEKTEQHLLKAKDFIQELTAKGGNILFVGTKKQAKDVMETEATRAGMPYINSRWLGGLLTNFVTVRQSIDKLRRLEKMEEDGTFENLKKKEVVRIRKEKEKLLRDLGGIRDMVKLPEVIFIVDTKREDIAVREAERLHIPIIAILDTNADPDPVTYPIPGNDDALKSIRFITAQLVDAAIEGKKKFDEAEAIRVRKESKGKDAKAKKVEAADDAKEEAAA